MTVREFLFQLPQLYADPYLDRHAHSGDTTPASLITGFVIALSGEFTRIWAVKHAGGATRTTSGVGGSVLITHGPYGMTRNPLYVGNFLLSTGLVIMAWAWMPYLLLLFWVLFFFQYSMIISLEEEFLAREFGDAYSKYCAAVLVSCQDSPSWPVNLSKLCR